MKVYFYPVEASLESPNIKQVTAGLVSLKKVKVKEPEPTDVTSSSLLSHGPEGTPCDI